MHQNFILYTSEQISNIKKVPTTHLYPNPHIMEVFREATILWHIYTWWHTLLWSLACLAYLGDIPGSMAITIDSLSLIDSLNQLAHLQTEQRSPLMLVGLP